MKKLLLILIITKIIYAQGNWQSLNWPGGGNINNIFKVNDSIFLCGVQHNLQLFRSTNKGADWQQVFQGSNPDGNKSVRAIILNDIDEIFVSFFNYGIRKSTDLGATWLATGAGGGEGMVNTDSGIMFGFDNVNSNNFLMKSVDSGRTWINISSPVSSIYSISTVNNIVFLGSSNCIYYSEDMGDTWTMYGTSIQGLVRAIVNINSNVTLVGTNESIYYTSDSGNTWILTDSGTAGRRVTGFKILNDIVWAMGDFGLIYSTDHGLNWNYYSNIINNTINAVAFKDSLILAATSRGVFSIKPDEWLYSSKGITGFIPKSIILTPGKIIYNSPSGFFYSTDVGNSWNLFDLRYFYDGGEIAIKDNHYLVYSSRKFYHSSDYGQNWIHTGSSLNLCSSLAFSKTSTKAYTSLYNIPVGMPGDLGFYVSTNFGAFWSRRSNFEVSRLNVLEGDVLLGKVLGFGGYGYEDKGVMISNNQGSTWLDMNAGLPMENISCLTADKNGNYFASFPSGIYRKDIDSSVFKRFTTFTGPVFFNKLNHVLVLRDGKIFGSVNGKKWDYCSEGVDQNNMVYLTADSLGYFYAADEQGKLFKTLISSIISKQPSVPDPVYPVNNVNVMSDTVEFKWNSASPMVFNYSLRISTDSLFTVYSDTVVTDTLLQIASLETNRKYFWKIKAENENGWSKFSPAVSFGNYLTGTDEEETGVTDYYLSQNFPNPFNPETGIIYEISPASQVVIKIFDVLGNEISTLVDEYKTAGIHKLTISAANLPSGVYFYFMTAGDYIKTRKMVVLK
jgi:hypothetical protein